MLKGSDAIQNICLRNIEVSRTSDITKAIVLLASIVAVAVAKAMGEFKVSTPSGPTL